MTEPNDNDDYAVSIDDRDEIRRAISRAFCPRDGSLYPEETLAIATAVLSTEAIRRLIRQRDTLAQAMWDTRAILGFDNDGDATPRAHLVSGYKAFAEHFVDDMHSERRDHDEASNWVCLHRQCGPGAGGAK